MESVLPIIDSRGHTLSCELYDREPSLAGNAHSDLFCNCHSWMAPRVLENGTDIAWPAGWDEVRAAVWRAGNNLVPSSEPVPGP